MRRRKFLAATGTAVAVLAGCSSDGSDGPPGGEVSGGVEATGTDGGSASGDPAGGGTATDAGDALAEAPIARDLDAQPAMGPDPTAAESVIVEVTDPSCPTCRSFHAQAFPTIRRELVETDKTAFVVRNVSWVYPWADRAAAALEAVHDRSTSAYWNLLDYYFSEQGRITEATVLGQTETQLEATEVDGQAAVTAVKAGEYDDAVAADEAAADAAGVDSQPYFFLFKDGRLRTSFYGPQSYGVFRSSLGY